MKLKRSHWILIGFMCLAGFMGYFIRAALFPELTQEDNFNIAMVTPVNGIAIWITMLMVHRLFNRLLPFRQGFDRNRVLLRIVLQLFIGVVIMMGFRYVLLDLWGSKYIQVIKMAKSFTATTYMLYFFVSLVINLGFFAELFFMRWKESIQFAERLEKEKTQVQYDNLKNQLNPHFLFNALTSLNSLIFEDQQLASRFLQQLSKVYRYLLQHRDRETVPLETEINFLDSYLSLLKTRFGTALQIELNIPFPDQQKALVPVSLQALIENALKHNVIHEQKPLTIAIYTENGYVWVSNNLQKKNRVEGSNGQGLENLKNLYHYLTSEPVQIISTETHFKVGLPLL